jgi:hypothetical protein
MLSQAIVILLPLGKKMMEPLPFGVSLCPVTLGITPHSKILLTRESRVERAPGKKVTTGYYRQ